jgi:putative two-component system response regulator
MVPTDAARPPAGTLSVAVGPPRRSTVLVIDDQAAPREMLSRVLEREGYVVTVAIDGDAGLRAICDTKPDVVILDVRLPGLNGFEVCRRVRADGGTRLTPIVMMTGYDAHAERLEGLSAGADDFLGKPFDIPELLARVASLARMKRYTDDLDSASAILTTLAAMIEGRFAYSPGHCHRMANYATAVGRALRASDADVQVLYRGAFLHDIGMLAISDAILQRPGPLSDDEYESVKSHTILGDALCANLQSLQCVRPIIRWHHERFDGSGYPDGLRGDAIPHVAQIVGVVEMFEALTTVRPYQQRFEADDALTLLRRHADRGWLALPIVDAMASVVESMSPH